MQRFLDSSLRRAVVLLIPCLLVGSAAQGQTTATTLSLSPVHAAPTPPTITSLALQVDRADAEAQRIGAGAHLRGIDDADLQTRLAAIPAVRSEIDDALAALEPRLKFADARLAELGPPPGPGQPAEDPEIAQERSKITTARRTIDTEVKQAHLISVEIDQLETYLQTRRRNLFLEQLWQRTRSPLDFRFWTSVGAAWPHDAKRAEAQFDGAPIPMGTGAMPLAAGALICALAYLALALGRLLLERLVIARWARASAPSQLRRAILALGLIAAAMLAASCVGMVLQTCLGALSGGRPIVTALLAILARVVVFASVFASLGRALLQPRWPAWRLAPLPDGLVTRIRRFPDMLGLTFAITGFTLGGDAALGFSAPVSSALQCVANLILLGTIGGTLLTIAHTAQAVSDYPIVRVARTSRLPWAIALIASWGALLSALAATLLGYVAFGSFILREVIWIATVLGWLFLFTILVDEALPSLLDPATRTGAFLRSSLGLSPAALRQGGVLLSGCARLGLLLLAWLAIWAPFGATAENLFGRLSTSDLILHLGQVTISPATIVIGFLVFLLGLVVTRAVRRWLEARYLPTTSMDIGAQNALGVGITYLGAILAIVMASAYLGLSLDRITLLASALSVGIGFGLQSIIGNFVSGLILLIERPVKVGDWIAIGDLDGDVRKISVRATEIEMADRSKLIVPNTDLISKTIRNVTRGSTLARLRIVLRVSDDADPILVRDLLKARLDDHPELAHEPAPVVYLTDVRDGALEFAATGYVASARDAYRIKSDLLFQIIPELRRSNIALATSSPVVNVGIGERAIEPREQGRSA